MTPLTRDELTEIRRNHGGCETPRMCIVCGLLSVTDTLRAALWRFDNHEERTPETSFCAGCDLGEWDEEKAPEGLHDDDCRTARAALLCSAEPAEKPKKRPPPPSPEVRRDRDGPGIGEQVASLRAEGEELRKELERRTPPMKVGPFTPGGKP